MVVFGLDFGTTFSSLGVLVDGTVHLLRQQDSPYIPTCLFFTSESHQVSFGYDALTYAQVERGKGSLFKDMKRWVGCDEENYTAYREKLQPNKPVTFQKFGVSDKSCPVLSADNEGSMKFALPDLIASYIRCIVKDAEKVMSVSCSGIVCSVPAAYNSSQRSLMMECVSLSGFTCLHIINEPSAAAFSSSAQLIPEDNFCLVYDFGGGTFDVSGVSVLNNTFVVRSSGGDMNLGGRDVDRKFIEFIHAKAGVLPVNYQLDVSDFKEKVSRLDYSLVYQLETPSGDVPVSVNKEELANVCRPFFERTLSIMKDVYRKYLSNVSSGSNSSETRKCVLIPVGGSSYLPGLKQVLSSVSYVSRVVTLPDARASVAAGCALYSLCLDEKSSMLLIDCCSHNISIPSYTCESIVMVPAGAPIPFSGKRTINLRRCTSLSSYNTALFEGDHTKCCRNTLIYTGTVPLSSIGVKSNIPTNVSITIELNISSVGTINFLIKGVGNATYVIGKDRIYDFSTCPSPSRTLRNLSDATAERVFINLVACRSTASRSALSVSDKTLLYDELSLSKQSALYLNKLSKYVENTQFSELYLGKSVQKLLRGSRLERLSY
nr:putative heat shock protein 70 [Thesium chinense closterovirus 1]